MTFPEAEQYLLSLANIPRREYMKDTKRCDVYLKRTQYLLDLLDNPEKKIPHYIHVTGTSGKGSVATFLHAILTAAGHKTGLLTSPHHTTITERWRMNNRQMSRQEFVALAKKIKPVLDHYLRTSPYDLISYHELMDVFGFLYFAARRARWAVLEVGLGGRYCSTNVIPWKDAAVITNIGWDHIDLIGPTEAAIAREKAGIITTRCLVFTAEKQKRLRAIFEAEAKKHGATVTYVTADEARIERTDIVTGTVFVYQNQRYRVSAPGAHQVSNAILAINVAQSLGIAAGAIVHGLAMAKQPLRLEVVSRRPLIILDGAHNVEKMRTTVESLYHFITLSPHHPKVHLLIGFSHDKPWPFMIKQLATLRPATIACTRNTVNPFRKVAPPEALARRGRQLLPRARIESFLDPKEALAWSRKHCRKNDILLITGSIFLSGELRPYLMTIPDEVDK